VNVSEVSFKSITNWKQPQVCTVELRSKGPGRKGIAPLREIIWGPINYFSYHFYIGYKDISIYGKNLASPVKSFGAKFHCSSICLADSRLLLEWLRLWKKPHIDNIFIYFFGMLLLFLYFGYDNILFKNKFQLVPWKTLKRE